MNHICIVISELASVMYYFSLKLSNSIFVLPKQLL